MHTRRAFFGSAALAWPGLSRAGFPAEQPERALYPCPADGAQSEVTPPGFAWWRVEGAASYRLVIQNSAGGTVYTAENLKDPVHLPDRTLAPGEYRWDVEACDEKGAVLARRGAWRFSVPRGARQLPWQDAKSLLARVPAEHPRYVFLGSELPRIRESLKTGRRAAWDAVQDAARKALKQPFPEPPRYHTFEGKSRQRMGYTVYFREFRGRVDSVLTPLSLAFLLTGEELYGDRARKLLLEIESWGIEGPMSLLSPFGDEPGLSLARHGQRAYDWLYPLFTSSERERVGRMTADRGRQILRRLRRADYLYAPAESHNGRLIAYLSEYAVVMKDEAPDAAEWLDYSLRALTTFYPHWGDSDGGWAEGISYALSYNSLYLGAIEALRAATGFDLYRRPFFRSVRRYFLYCTSPIGEMKPFGDGAEGGGVGSQGAMLMQHHGRRFQDPACLWWARQTGEAAGGDPLIPMLTEDTLAPEPPSKLPSAAVFRGIGWAALHSALDQPKQDTFFLFKSSPFGSVSHSHADQNGFAILKGGRALAIPSGHYGPSYGMPHHADWTRQTKANNSILVNGEGQVVRSSAAKGRIAEFRHQQAITYLCGDAAAAYGGKLKRFLRHVVFLRPGAFLVLDELEAPVAAQFSWLLHAFEKMEVDEAAARVISRRKGASLEVRLASQAGLAFALTDQFDPPYNEGNPPEYHRQVDNHWHFTARTKTPAAAARIAALMVVRGEGEELEVEWKQERARAGMLVRSAAGSGEIWANLSPVAPPGITARWQPRQGPVETFRIAE